jgi:hypothetical protein
MNGPERDRLDVIEGKIDLVLVKLEYVEKKADDHEGRLRSTEKWRYGLPASLLMAAVAFIAAIIRTL